jgi:hypothetical protein
MEKIKDFGDLVDAVLEARKTDAAAKREAEKVAAIELQEKLEMKLKPLLTAIRHTKEKYPNINTYGCELGEVHTPHFYTKKISNNSVYLVYDESLYGRQFRLEDRCGPIKTLAISNNVEDLIPPLIDLLATAVAFKYRR